MVYLFISFLCFYVPCRDLGSRIRGVNRCKDPHRDPAIAGGVVCSEGQEGGEGWKGKWWDLVAVGFIAQMHRHLGIDLHNDNKRFRHYMK